MLNFLYCFDNNYNFQGFTSIISLLDSVDEKINISIIHSNELLNSAIPELITKHKYLNSLSIYKFNDTDYDFPNLKDKHVSMATYYRLFIENYITDDIPIIIYLDADTICLNNPINELKNQISILKNSEFTISAKTEVSYDENNLLFSRLNITNNYFNAGVLIINLQRWKSQSLSKNLINQMIDLSSKINFWDQDVLNSFFNGRYVELSNNLNYNSIDNIGNHESINIIHYIGSKKPWYLSGIFENSSDFYHSNYYKLSKKRYHIIHLWKLSSITDLIISVITLKIFKLQKPISFIKCFFTSF